MQTDYLIYGVHAAFWGAFGITRAILSRLAEPVVSPTPAPAAASPQTAPYSRALLGFHMVGFGTMYFGLNQAVLGNQVPERWPLQRLAGSLVMALGAALMCWALAFFRSWRFRAQLAADHELATGGPFALVRHPIYLGLNLLGIGTALWIPSGLELAAAVLLIVGSDLRCRAEEKLLLQAFGERYRAYMKQTRRMIPGLY